VLTIREKSSLHCPALSLGHLPWGGIRKGVSWSWSGNELLPCGWTWHMVHMRLQPEGRVGPGGNWRAVLISSWHLCVFMVTKASVSVSVVPVFPGSAMPSRVLSMMSDISGHAATGKGELWEREGGKTGISLSGMNHQIHFPELLLLLIANAKWHAWGCVLLGTFRYNSYFSQP
jgi:hypothetical protein